MLQITSIKPASRIKNRIWLSFSDSSFLPFFIDDVVKLSLQKNQEIDDQKLELITTKSLFYVGQEYALRQIAISPKTEKIIKQKLKAFFYKIIIKYQIKAKVNTDDIINEILAKLIDRELLNSKSFITYFVKKNQRKSKRQILFLLQQQGINSESISSDIFDQTDDVEKIKKILIKKKFDADDFADFNKKNKITSSLYNKGFSLSDIKCAIDDLLNFR